MSLSTLKKRKVDSENRQFNSEWTRKYLFVFATGKPVCILCSECISHSCASVRFFDGECFREDLLGLIPLDGHTTGEILFEKVISFFRENQLELDRINMPVTDGAPAMSGRTRGLSARLADPPIRHCLIHQSLMCAKLSGELKDTMDSVMAIINFICSTSSLQHRLFRQLLSDMSAQYTDLLIHKDIRWLSKGNALKRFCELKEEILAFLHNSK
ncbi:SCAN domain-containing protein 3 [Merluccius polli]|uniref:SCAN domain-containing protein 3 n=1 Tax=Merluccius polli TaxID=89951 RepID=A0AA47M8J3_MERPO|nr:SCAN domain-containing protein 3 [Merluccius polli]